MSAPNRPSSDRFRIWGQRLPKERKLKAGLQPTVLHEIPVPLDSDVEEFEALPATPIDVDIRGLEFLGSYSWVMDSTPTIVVPGTWPPGGIYITQTRVLND